MMAWFYKLMGEEIGPISSTELRTLAQRGTISADTPVRKGQNGTWIPANRVQGLFSTSDADIKGDSPRENIPLETKTPCSESSPQLRPTKACPYCAERILAAAIKCRYCGSDLSADDITAGFSARSTTKQIDPDRYIPSPLFAAFLSFFIAGLGQMVCGQVLKGFIILLATVVLCILTLGISIFITVPFAMIDAYRIAEKLKAGKIVREWECF